MIIRQVNFNEDSTHKTATINLFTNEIATNAPDIDDNLFFVIENNRGDMLGAAEARIENKHIFKLLNFAIHPGFRNQGLGSEFLVKLETYVTEMLSLQLTMIKLIPGGDSRAFYENRGYERDWIILFKKL